jgi:hypothetical protein
MPELEKKKSHNYHYLISPFSLANPDSACCRYLTVSKTLEKTLLNHSAGTQGARPGHLPHSNAQVVLFSMESTMHPSHKTSMLRKVRKRTMTKSTT